MSLQIIAPYAPLYCKPCPEAERDDEIWFGQGVEVLEELEDGWLRVRTCYGYESYLEARYIGEEPQGEPWMVLSPWADVLAAPKHQAPILLTLPRGSRVRAWGENRGWVRVALPGGRGGLQRPVPYRLPAPGNPHLSQFPSGAWLWGPGDPPGGLPGGGSAIFSRAYGHVSGGRPVCPRLRPGGQGVLRQPPGQCGRLLGGSCGTPLLHRQHFSVII